MMKTKGEGLCPSPFVFAIIRNRHPELVSGSMVYRKSEMLKKFQHDSDIVKVSIFDYGLWFLVDGLTF
jgi:hypothetical protein